MAAHICKPNIQEAEEKGFKASLGHILTSCLKDQNRSFVK